jgi:hypothetical protein
MRHFSVHPSTLVHPFILAIWACLFNLYSVSAQPLSFPHFANVRIDNPVAEGYIPCEPSIAIDPTNPDRIVAGAILDKVYVSEDAGVTWTEDQLKSPHGVFGDPCIVAGPQGDFYYLHLSDPKGDGWNDEGLLDRIVCQHLKPGGSRWSRGSGIGLNGSKDQDKEWAAISPSGERIAVCWTEFDAYGSETVGDSTRILCSTSDRKAKRWSEPVRVSAALGNCLDSDSTTEGAVPVWIDEHTLAVSWAFDQKLWFDISTDGGLTWGEDDTAITGIIGGWDLEGISGIGRANGMPVTAIDRSPRFPGRIYVNWADQRNGEHDTDIWLVWSDDRGSSWSDPVRVNNDPPGKQQFFTWMAVDPITGHVHIVFYDRRAYSDSTTDVVVATSTNGGSFFVNRIVSESGFLPNGKTFFGDYNNISAYGGRVRPIWTRNHRGDQGVWTVLLEDF